jgi:hypothetical protein
VFSWNQESSSAGTSNGSSTGVAQQQQQQQQQQKKEEEGTVLVSFASLFFSSLACLSRFFCTSKKLQEAQNKCRSITLMKLTYLPCR